MRPSRTAMAVGVVLLAAITANGAPFQAGVVFKLDPTEQQTVLHSFTGETDGSRPGAGVILDKAGNLYGTTQYGGDLSKCSNAGCGVVFKLSPTGKETVLYTFTGSDGASPASNLIQDATGNLYGTTELGGTNGNGVVFKLSPTGKETVLYTFTGGPDGGRPAAGLVPDDQGNLYGTTPVGGDLSCSVGPIPGCGVVFKLDQTGKETVLYAFTGGIDGELPYGSLLLSGGDLYGTTYLGGASGNGVVFNLDPSGRETVLYTFTGGTDGGSPSVGLILDSAGNLYGTAQDGGDFTFPGCGCGVVFKLQPYPSAGSQEPQALSSPVYTVLHAFTGGFDGDGAFPNNGGSGGLGLTRDEANNLYGVATEGGDLNKCVGFNPGCGVVFEVDAGGKEKVLHTFTGPDGANPGAAPVRDDRGNLYGTTMSGGSSPTPTSSSTPTMTPTSSPTTALTPTPTATAIPGPAPIIASVPSAILVGASFNINGSHFSAIPKVNFFVATSSGPVNAGPLTPSFTSASLLTVPVPASVTLGQGFVTIQVVNTDQGFKASNLASALLQGSAGAGIPTLKSINGVGLAATSGDPNFATNNVQTVIVQGSPVKLGGTGFDAAHGVAVNVFCACTDGKLGPIFVNPGAGLTSTSFNIILPASVPTGPASLGVINKGGDGSYSKSSNAVSVVVGHTITVTSVSQVGTSITVNGTGFFTLTVINFFNKQGATTVNLGGLNAGGAAKIPLTVVNSTKFTFIKPAGAGAGASYVQALNPPFVPYTSSGTDPGGAFTLK